MRQLQMTMVRIVGLVQRPNGNFVALLTWMYGQGPPNAVCAAFLAWGKALNYRLYCFDGVGKVWAPDWLRASSDDEAIALAQAMDVGVKCEIWEGKRLVATIEPRLRAPGGHDDQSGHRGFAAG